MQKNNFYLPPVESINALQAIIDVQRFADTSSREYMQGLKNLMYKCNSSELLHENQNLNEGDTYLGKIIF
jgi:hypothetical protein